MGSLALQLLLVSASENPWQEIKGRELLSIYCPSSFLVGSQGADCIPYILSLVILASSNHTVFPFMATGINSVQLLSALVYYILPVLPPTLPTFWFTVSF